MNILLEVTEPIGIILKKKKGEDKHIQNIFINESKNFKNRSDFNIGEILFFDKDIDLIDIYKCKKYIDKKYKLTNSVYPPFENNLTHQYDTNSLINNELYNLVTNRKVIIKGNKNLLLINKKNYKINYNDKIIRKFSYIKGFSDTKIDFQINLNNSDFTLVYITRYDIESTNKKNIRFKCKLD